MAEAEAEELRNNISRERSSQMGPVGFFQSSYFD